MTARPVLWLALLAALAFPFAAAAQPTPDSCTGSITDIAFGAVLVGSPGTYQTTGTLNLSCVRNSGNPSNVGACVELGAGSGGASGASPNITTRFMTSPSAPGAQLGYALRRATGGVIWNRETITIERIGSAYTLSIPILAEIVTPGGSLAPGDYSSSFSGLANAVVRPGTCPGTGPGTALPFTVSATVSPSCTVSADDMMFGLVAPTVGAPVDAAAAVRVTCSTGVQYSVSLGLGQGPGVSDPAQRRMTSGANTLAYGLFRDGGRTLVWGNQPGNRLSGQTGSGAEQVFPVFGRIPAGQTAAPGDYADTVIVTVEY